MWLRSFVLLWPLWHPWLGGAMLLRFATEADRDLVRELSPIHHNGATLELERPQETSNRFFREAEWLAYVAVVDYPPKHWEPAHIRRSIYVRVWQSRGD